MVNNKKTKKTLDTQDSARNSKKIKNWLLIALVITFLGFVASVVFPRYFAPISDNNNSNQENESPNINITDEEPEPPAQKFYSKLDGTETSQSKVNARPLAVVIENHPEARPQVGFSEASHVWEYIAEGGITRFLAVYGPNLPKKVGPIRSARTFSVSWAAGYHSLFVHAGGSQGGLGLIPTLKSLVDLPHTSGYFYREPSPGVAIEHTLFSDGESLINFAKAKGASLTGSFRSPLLKESASKAEDRPETHTLTINFSTPSYLVKWTYNKAKNLYERELAGSKHIDRLTKKQLTAQNIVILTVNRSFVSNTNGGKGEWFMTTEGRGVARVYSEGKLITGTWNKASKDSMLILRDSRGTEIPLLPGQTWFEVIPSGIPVSYTGN